MSMLPPVGDAPSTSAKAIITSALTSYGLGSLAERVWGWYTSGVPLEQIFLDLRQTPEYKARFPAMAALDASGHSISEQQYIDYERTVSQIMHDAGLPSGFYDQPDDFTQFLVKNVSPTEIQQRVQLAAQAVYQSDPVVRSELQRLYGVDAGHLTAYWLDPDRAEPLLAQQFLSSQIAADANRSRYGELSLGEATNLAQLGVTDQQAQQGFAQLYGDLELFNPLPGQQGPTIGRAGQLGAMFGGDAEAQRQIEQVAATRKAAFAGGGQFATSKEGIEGLGALQQ